MSAPSYPRLLGRGRLLRGSNAHHRRSVFVQSVDPGGLANILLVEAGPELASRYVERFGSLPTAPDASLLDALLGAILAVERIAAVEMGRLDDPHFACMVPTSEGVELVWEAHAAWISRTAAPAALTGLLELLPSGLAYLGGRPQDRRRDFGRTVARLRRQARRRQWAPAAARVVEAARARGLPHELLAGSYVRLGEGASQEVVSASAARHEGAGELLERLFPAGPHATIRVALIVGDRGTRFVGGAMDRLLRSSRDGVGLAARGRTTIQGRAMDPTSLGRRRGLAVLLRDPRVETVVSAASARHIVSRGLGVEHVEVAVLTDPAPRRDPSTYMSAVRVVLAASTGMVVIHAENPFAERVMQFASAVAPELPGGAAGSMPEVVLVAERASSRLGVGHCEAGGLVVQLAGPVRRWHAEISRGREVLGAMRLVWPRARPPAIPSRLELRRALLAVGGAFALDLTDRSLASTSLMPLPRVDLPRPVLGLHGHRPEAVLELSQSGTLGVGSVVHQLEVPE